MDSCCCFFVTSFFKEGGETKREAEQHEREREIVRSRETFVRESKVLAAHQKPSLNIKPNAKEKGGIRVQRFGKKGKRTKDKQHRPTMNIHDTIFTSFSTLNN